MSQLIFLRKIKNVIFSLGTSVITDHYAPLGAYSDLKDVAVHLYLIATLVRVQRFCSDTVFKN